MLVEGDLVKERVHGPKIYILFKKYGTKTAIKISGSILEIVGPAAGLLRPWPRPCSLQLQAIRGTEDKARTPGL